MKAYGLYLWYYSQLNDFILDNYSNLFHGILLFVGSNLRQVSVGSKCSRASTFSPKWLKFQHFSYRVATQGLRNPMIFVHCPRIAGLSTVHRELLISHRAFPEGAAPPDGYRMSSNQLHIRLKRPTQKYPSCTKVLQNQPVHVPCHRQNLSPFPQILLEFSHLICRPTTRI